MCVYLLPVPVVHISLSTGLVVVVACPSLVMGRKGPNDSFLTVEAGEAKGEEG